MKNNIASCSVALILMTILHGCSDQSQNSPTPKTDDIPVAAAAKPAPIRNQPISGTVNSRGFYIEQAILKDGDLILRRGNDFFADASVEVGNFYDGDPSGRTFTWTGEFMQSKPFIRTGFKTNVNQLPNTAYLSNDYDLDLVFGAGTELGIPFSIKLVDEKENTLIEGKSFATYGNLRLIDNEIDLHFDSFDTLEYLAKKHLNEKYGTLKYKEKFGISTVSYGDTVRTKTGFVGYETEDKHGQNKILKVQLLKDINGWRVENELTGQQINIAHALTPTAGNDASKRDAKAMVPAANELQRYLNDTGIMNNVRATSGTCRTYKKHNKATCTLVYGLKEDDATVCKAKSYLVRIVDNDFLLESEVDNDQKIDYRTGELITQKPHTYMCQ